MINNINKSSLLQNNIAPRIFLIQRANFYNDYLMIRMADRQQNLLLQAPVQEEKLH